MKSSGLRGAPLKKSRFGCLAAWPLRPGQLGSSLSITFAFRIAFPFTNEHQDAWVSSVIRRRNGVGPPRLPGACSVHKFLVSRVEEALACANQGSHIGNSSEVK
jgi:hypothetical protein